MNINITNFTLAALLHFASCLYSSNLFEKKQFNENIINKVESKVCVVCNTEKRIDNFYDKDRECKQCNIERSLKRYYENKDNLSNQRKIY